jgi:hypothetical protein
MRAITIEAKSFESAQGIHSALSEFRPELFGNDDQGYSVSVRLDTSDSQLLRLLDAIERFATERQTFARVEMDGHRYTIHGEGSAHD